MEQYIQLVTKAVQPVMHGRLPPPEVAKALISKTLGYGIVAGASIVKLPQVLNVVRSGSADGLAAATFELEQLTYMVSLLYSYTLGMPFSAYGESSLLLLQNCLLLALVYHHSGSSKLLAALKAALFFGALGAGLAGHIPSDYLAAAYELSAVMMIIARVPQILKAFQEKSTGQLSSITTAANFLGSLARIFTSYADKGGQKMVRNYSLAALLHFISLAQIVVYRTRSAKQKKQN